MKFKHLPLFLFLIIGLNLSYISTRAIETKSVEPLEMGEYKNFHPTGKIIRFDGESLYYDISFLWFEKAATAKVSFFKANGKYFSVLEASTTGFVGFFTSYRKHFYKTEFEVIDNGRTLRPKTFLRQVTIADTIEMTKHKFDYSRRLHTWEKHLNEKKIDTGQDEIPEEGAFNDILSSFYNIRNSVYGKLKQGKKFVIRTIPEKGHDKISVNIWSEKDKELFRIEEGRKEANLMLLNIIVPKEIFKTETGELMVWSSKHYIPVETTVKDYILLGDLHARFTHMEVR